MGVALMMVALLAGVYALVMIRVFWRRREYAKAVAAGKWLLAGVAVYLAALIAVSVASPPKVASGSEEVRLCDALGDCSLAVYVLEAEQRRTLGNPPQEMISDGVYYIVTVKVTSYSANPAFAPGDLTAFVVDDSGASASRFPEGERPVHATLSRENPYQVQSGPTGGSFKKTFVFDVPADAKNPCLIVRAGGWLDRLLQLFVIGDEDSLFHPGTRLPLNVPRPRI